MHQKKWLNLDDTLITIQCVDKCYCKNKSNTSEEGKFSLSLVFVYTLAICLIQTSMYRQIVVPVQNN